MQTTPPRVLPRIKRGPLFSEAAGHLLLLVQQPLFNTQVLERAIAVGCCPPNVYFNLKRDVAREGYCPTTRTDVEGCCPRELFPTQSRKRGLLPKWVTAPTHILIRRVVAPSGLLRIRSWKRGLLPKWVIAHTHMMIQRVVAPIGTVSIQIWVVAQVAYCPHTL